jgi:hypothetical protein
MFPLVSTSFAVGAYNSIIRFMYQVFRHASLYGRKQSPVCSQVFAEDDKVN